MLYDIPPISPMEPILIDKPFDSENYLFQVKWDGVRILTYLGKNSIRLFNRKQNERPRQFPEIEDSLAYLPPGTVLDGEAICLGADGKPNFILALKRDQTKDKHKIMHLARAYPINYMIFDMPYLEGESLVDRPLSERQRLMKEVIKLSTVVHLVESVEIKGKALFDAVNREGMEGIVAKDVASRYIAGQKSPYWKKVKAWREIDAYAGGWVKKEGQLRSLLVGVPGEKGLVYIGSVSSGLTQEQKGLLRSCFESSCSRNKMPFIKAPDKDGVKWVEPEIKIRIKYLEWSNGGMLRNPSIIKLSNRNGLFL